MEWSQFIILIIAFVGLFTWNRSESRSDYRHMDTYLKANRDLINAIHIESKEFHTRLAVQDLEFKMRLASIEERNKEVK